MNEEEKNYNWMKWTASHTTINMSKLVFPAQIEFHLKFNKTEWYKQPISQSINHISERESLSLTKEVR